MFRRRQNIRFYVIIGSIIICVFFFLMLIQFNQIETDTIVRQSRYNKNARAKADGETYFKNLQNKVFRKFAGLDDFGNKLAEPDAKKAELSDGSEWPIKAKEAVNSMQKLVHLDLKGAPPKLNYLKELIPFFKKAGATGVLIEYEDFYPYHNDLESIRNQNHYTTSEIKQIFDLLKENDLSIIPLIQTYGHMEFVLKLKQYAYLREEKEHFNVISPCVNDTYDKVVFKMIDQILELHPEDIQYIHIGCDEVYSINKNAECKSLELSTVQDYFIYHIGRILDYIKKKRRNLRVMIWEDMIRKNMINQNDGADNKLRAFARRIVPVVWNYVENVEISDGTWKIYNEIFNEIWIASAFKGATQNLEIMPNARAHFSNHLSWLNIIKYFLDPRILKGIMLTGWSRYDHMQAVCETLPAAIPSLVLCLQVLSNYDQPNDVIFTKTRNLTKCTYEKTLTGFLMDPTNRASALVKSVDVTKADKLYKCDFPGADAYNWLLSLRLHLTKFEFRNKAYSNVLNNFSLKNAFFNTMVYKRANEMYKFYRVRLEEFKASGESIFDKYFYGDLYLEFTSVYIQNNLDLIEERLARLNRTAIPEYAAVRPFEKISHNLI